MRDLFARWATRATGATEPESTSNHGDFPGPSDVAQPASVGATRATPTPAAGEPVAHVAHEGGSRATRGEPEKAGQDKDSSRRIAHVAHVAHEDGKAERYALADCLALIREAFESVRADYVSGALALLDTDPALCQQFRQAETAVDAVVKVGPTERELRAALAAHVAVIRECIDRRRAQMEAAADCHHATDSELRAWRRGNPALECARCWLERGR